KGRIGNQGDEGGRTPGPTPASLRLYHTRGGAPTGWGIFSGRPLGASGQNPSPLGGERERLLPPSLGGQGGRGGWGCTNPSPPPPSPKRGGGSRTPPPFPGREGGPGG